MGAIAIVRLSGPATRALAARMIPAAWPLHARHATNVTILDEDERAIDRGLALFFEAPHSYTGEDVLELHVHGSPAVAREVLRVALAAGARYALAGEFTRRAVLNGKMDLHAADAVADLIAAQTRAAALAAAANLSGGVGTEVAALRARLTGTLEELAGAVDFPEEVPDPERGELLAAIEAVAGRLEQLRREGELGRLVREGVGVAIVGPPNAGKSSLLNALLGEDRAIVSELPGTTRDTIEEAIAIDGVAVRLVDTAGLREHADRIEAQGIERTRHALAMARIALVVLDGSVPLGPEARDILDRTQGRERVLFLNKADLGEAGVPAARESAPGEPAVVGSVRDERTLEALRRSIAAAGWGGELPDLSHPHLASARELDAANEALEALGRAAATLRAGEPVDFVAGELGRAFAALGHVSERVAAEEVLGGIFARFCIGK
ncbi:MAG: tRNA uridine-5-carboxymethylaminomethyl(34) synthesis GTPase MnmE [Candidatus Eremiobacteraeota bacterium]|nr:tRNA uridine-5-carboxymethylaminomethyl(34) synthesis GTPase MnmE [Candidatus Eremiobacteraeota bacterium]